MAEEIINRVAKSKLITLDLEDFYPKGKRIVLDIKDWLFQELILKEKDFRDSVTNHNWEQYLNSYVALTCSSDAIIPSWAYLLITTRLNDYAKKVVVGDLELLETVIYQEVIQQLDTSEYTNKPVIIKGCTNKPIPASAYTLLVQKIQSVTKTIMFGEACSTVPLYKAKK
jgi:WD40 repeat protein